MSIHSNLEGDSKTMISCKPLQEQSNIISPIHFLLGSPAGFKPARKRYLASQKSNNLQTELSRHPTVARSTIKPYLIMFLDFWIAKELMRKYQLKSNNQSRTNDPINAHLTIAQGMPRYNHNNEKQEALL